MANTPTTNLSYNKPAAGDRGWGTTMNANLDAIDTDLGSEHKDGGAHGPKVTITQTADDNALTISQTTAASANVVVITNTGSGDAIQIDQDGNGVVLDINKTHTGSAIIIDITNGGSGADISGNSGNWSVDPSGDAFFNRVQQNQQTVNVDATATAATVNFASGNQAVVNLANTSSCAITLSGTQNGEFYTVLLVQSTDGGHAVTWVNTIRWPDGVEFAETTSASATDLVRFATINSQIYGSGQNFS